MGANENLVLTAATPATLKLKKGKEIFQGRGIQSRDFAAGIKYDGSLNVVLASDVPQLALATPVDCSVRTKRF